MWFQRVGFVDFSRAIYESYVIILLLYEQVRVRGVVFVRFFGFVQQDTSIRYLIVCTVVLVVFWGTLLRQIVGAVVPIPQSTTLHNVLFFCLFFIFTSSGGWVKMKRKLPHFHVSDTYRVSI